MDKDTDLRVFGKKGAPNTWLNSKGCKMLYLVEENRMFVQKKCLKIVSHQWLIFNC